jgi:hypothetical protein
LWDWPCRLKLSTRRETLGENPRSRRAWVQASSGAGLHGGVWKRVDVGHNGILEGKELDKFRSVRNTVDNEDGKISQSEFMTACQKGELKHIQL